MTLLRFDKLTAALANASLESIALIPSPSLRYLTGLDFHLMERPVVLFVRADGMAAIVLPTLETGRLDSLAFQVHPFSYSDNPATWQMAFNQAVSFLKLEKAAIGVEPIHFRFLETQFIKAAAPSARLVAADTIMDQLRIQKDDAEITAMKTAVQIAQNAFLGTLPAIQPGVSEREIAAELVLQLLRCGSEPEFPFQPIVSAGENSANPHATPTNRKLQSNEILLIDWGASFEGYCSDLTRVLAVGYLPAELNTIHTAVHQANRAALAAAQPGIPAGVVDQAARKVIERARYGPQFNHRVGHGLGLEAHEPPYMFTENQHLLEPGAAFTIEPGIYLAGLGGVRIEDDVLITNDGAECLSDLPREIFQLG